MSIYGSLAAAARCTFCVHSCNGSVTRLNCCQWCNTPESRQELSLEVFMEVEYNILCSGSNPYGKCLALFYTPGKKH